VPTTTAPSRSPVAVLAAVAAALAAAFVVAPPVLAGVGSDVDLGTDLGDERRLSDAFRVAFVGYWRSGEREFPPDLRSVVDYWFRFHVVKAVVAALLLAVLVALGARLWRAFARGGNRAAFASAGVFVTLVAVFALATVMANVQGAATPFASLLPMLVDRPADGDLAGTLEQVRQQLAGGGSASPAVDVLVDDFARYHAAMAVIATVVAVGLVGAGVVLWRRSHRAFAALFAVVAVVATVVAVANAGTAADPEPALLAFFEGGW
jgi:hypothetical protein